MEYTKLKAIFQYVRRNRLFFLLVMNSLKNHGSAHFTCTTKIISDTIIISILNNHNIYDELTIKYVQKHLKKKNKLETKDEQFKYKPSDECFH